MSLTAAKMSEEVWLTCLTHALSTETEEIMGLLLGDIQYSSNGKATALIWGASPQTRSDRRKDRVETNPEQLAAASAQAERMTLTTGRTTRVIGWYHSHPHITVLPSHVDVRTQAMYQLLDAGFIGLIFSCFSEDARKVGRIQVIAFQSLDGKQKHTLKTPLPVSSANSSSVAEPGLSWGSTDILQSTSGSGRLENFEQETADSKQAVRAVKVGGRPDSPSHLEEFFAHADGRGQMEVDSIDTSSSMQEALHLSNLDMRGADYVRKEIPLQVLPTSALLELDSSLTSFTDLQNVLFEEERAAYSQAITQSTREGKIHPFAFIHHTSTYQASMCKLMEYCLSPAINSLQDRLKENEIRLAMLMEEAKALEVEAFNRGSSPTFDSARHGFRRSFSSGQGDINATIGIGGRSRKAP